MTVFISRLTFFDFYSFYFDHYYCEPVNTGKGWFRLSYSHESCIQQNFVLVVKISFTFIFIFHEMNRKKSQNHKTMNQFQVALTICKSKFKFNLAKTWDQFKSFQKIDRLIGLKNFLCFNIIWSLINNKNKKVLFLTLHFIYCTMELI